MKKKFLYVLVISLLLNGVLLFSNNNNVFGQDYYTRFSISGGDVVMKDYKKSGEVAGNPYFSKSWVKGSVKTIDNAEYSDNLLFMYDKVESKLFFKKQDSSTIREADPDKIYSFTLITDKPHVFMRGTYISPDYKNKFFEVLILDLDEYSLFKYIATTFEKPETSRATQALTQNLSDGQYVDDVTYFIYFHNVLHPVELKKKSFPKAFKENTDKIENYIKSNNGSFNEVYATNLLLEINKELN